MRSFFHYMLSSELNSTSLFLIFKLINYLVHEYSRPIPNEWYFKLLKSNLLISVKLEFEIVKDLI